MSGLRVFANDSEDGFNPRSSHTKDSKMVLDASLLNTLHYKVGIKRKVEQSVERSRALEKEAFGSPSTKVANFTFLLFMAATVSLRRP